MIFATFAKPNENNAIVSCVNQVQDSDLATKGIATLVYAVCSIPHVKLVVALLVVVLVICLIQRI